NDFSESRRFPGTIWIATNGGGVSRFTDGSFRTYKTGDSPWSNRVNAVFEDFSGTVWCGADEGLFRIRGDSVEKFRPDLKDFIGIVETPDSSVWIATQKNLFSWRKDAFRPFAFELDSHTWIY